MRAQVRRHRLHRPALEALLPPRGQPGQRGEARVPRRRNVRRPRVGARHGGGARRGGARLRRRASDTPTHRPYLHDEQTFERALSVRFAQVSFHPLIKGPLLLVPRPAQSPGDTSNLMYRRVFGRIASPPPLCVLSVNKRVAIRDRPLPSPNQSFHRTEKRASPAQISGDWALSPGRPARTGSGLGPESLRDSGVWERRSRRAADRLGTVRHSVLPARAAPASKTLFSYGCL